MRDTPSYNPYLPRLLNPICKVPYKTCNIKSGLELQCIPLDKDEVAVVWDPGDALQQDHVLFGFKALQGGKL